MANASSTPALTTRIPSLDGLRAVSIFLVMALHSLQRYSLSHPVAWGWYGVFDGGAGVFLFFEISGFLITTLLLEEHGKRGSIGLRGFFLRRAFRILPPLYLYIGVVAGLHLRGLLPLGRADVVSALFFFHNFSIASVAWPLEHLWSISVEEQFYLVWPFALVWGLRAPGVQGRYRAAIFPAAVVIVSPLARVALGLTHNPLLRQLGPRLNFDFLMFGCLVALLQHTPLFESGYRRLTRVWWAPPAAILACNVLSARYRNYFDLPVGYTIEGSAMAMFLLWCIRNSGSAVGRALNWRPVIQIGVLSYSIYLWQTLFLHEGNDRVFGLVLGNTSIAPLGQFPLNWFGIVAVAALSYWAVEQPALHMRRKLSGRRS